MVRARHDATFGRSTLHGDDMAATTSPMNNSRAMRGRGLIHGGRGKEVTEQEATHECRKLLESGKDLFSQGRHDMAELHGDLEHAYEHGPSKGPDAGRYKPRYPRAHDLPRAQCLEFLAAQRAIGIPWDIANEHLDDLMFLRGKAVEKDWPPYEGPQGESLRNYDLLPSRLDGARKGPRASRT